jgi:hypothetical protein
MTPPFSDSIPILRSPDCKDNPEPGDFTPNQRRSMKVMIAAEHFLKLLGIIAATAFTAVCLTLWVESAHAQSGQRGTQAETNVRLEMQESEITHRLDNMDQRLHEMDRTITDLRSSISNIQGIGAGFGAILILIGVVSFLVQQQKSK